tara:strand:+ start:953 stop:1252 length:300 start_codon:yes stop_codon:yes gene_type:complete
VNKINSETFTRSDIEKSLRKEFPNLSKSQISSALNIITDSITDAIALDEKVEIRGFGTFSKKFIRPRKFINPKTKKTSYLGETATMHFKPSSLLLKKFK